MKASRRKVLQGGAAMLALPLANAGAQTRERLELWYASEAKEWNEALPLGNGRLGAMHFGGVAQDRLQINEATLWGGGPRDYTNPNAFQHLAQIRKLIFAGKEQDAERLTKDMMGVPSLLMPYQPFCDMRLEVSHSGAVSAYRRSLSLDDASARVTYAADGTRFSREVFASHPGQVIVVHLTADRPGQHSLSVGLDTPQAGAQTTALGLDGLQLTGQIGPRDNPANSWVGSWTNRACPMPRRCASCIRAAG
jgi:alpha-L-fucosidase 2